MRLERKRHRGAGQQDAGGEQRRELRGARGVEDGGAAQHREDKEATPRECEAEHAHREAGEEQTGGEQGQRREREHGDYRGQGIDERPVPLELPPRADERVGILTPPQRPRRKPELVEVAPADAELAGAVVEPEHVGRGEQGDGHCDRQAATGRQRNVGRHAAGSPILAWAPRYYGRGIAGQ